jgi:hypothetical protein
MIILDTIQVKKSTNDVGVGLPTFFYKYQHVEDELSVIALIYYRIKYAYKKQS